MSSLFFSADDPAEVIPVSKTKLMREGWRLYETFSRAPAEEKNKAYIYSIISVLEFGLQKDARYAISGFIEAADHNSDVRTGVWARDYLHDSKLKRQTKYRM